MTKVVLLEGRFHSQTSSVPSWWIERLRSDFPDFEVVQPDSNEMAKVELADADTAFGLLSPEMLSTASRLRLLQAPMANPPDGFLFPELVEHPVVVTRMTGVYDDHIGTHVMSFILSFARGLDLCADAQFERVWRRSVTDENVIHLADSTVVMVGVGGIARFAARICAAFGMTVYGVDVRSFELSEGIVEIRDVADLDELLSIANFVVDTLPDAPTTRGFFDRKRFQSMRSSAFFINVGRGSTANLDDLADALGAGELAGAGLDVFEFEPLPAEHAIWEAKRVILTPHVAVRGPYLDERRYERFADNLRRLQNDEPLLSVMDKTLGF